MDEVVMVKLLVLQSWYGLSDPELERQVDDRLSFQRFLGYLGKAPDYSTVWQFRERFAESGRDRLVWAELQRQLDEKGLKVRKGVAQDASFITADPGHAPAEEPRGYDATMRRGTWGHPLGIRDKLRNRRINRKRAPVERAFAVIKRVFHAGHVLVTTVPRVHVKMVFACFCFNLLQLGTLAARS